MQRFRRCAAPRAVDRKTVERIANDRRVLAIARDQAFEKPGTLSVGQILARAACHCTGPIVAACNQIVVPDVLAHI